jgi:hypothetical protein
MLYLFAVRNTSLKLGPQDLDYGTSQQVKVLANRLSALFWIANFEQPSSTYH